jgi:hypothetical protein
MEAPAAAGFRFVLIRTSSVGNCIWSSNATQWRAVCVFLYSFFFQ